MDEQKLKLIDLEDNVIHEMTLPARPKGAPPRLIVYMGRRFVECDGGPDSFYPGGGVLIEEPRS